MKTYIIANWKMNPTTKKEVVDLLNSINHHLKKIPLIFKSREIIICPPFVYFFLFEKILKKGKIIKLGAQNCFWEEKGAFTGEISPLMVKEMKVEYVILGHSERRHIFGETNTIINKKINAALKAELIPIFCLGETFKERKSGKTLFVIKKQLQEGLKGIKLGFSKKSPILIAYEPVWAIGTGNFCEPKEAKKILDFLKNKMPNVPVLYGGSVNSSNFKDYLKIKFDGLLIGGASLKKEEFLKIIET